MPNTDRPRRWPPGVGLAVGLATGVALGAAAGNLIDRTAIGMVFGLAAGLVLGLLIDDPRRVGDSGGEEDGPAPDNGGGAPPEGDDPRSGGPEAGAIARAMLWLLAGLVGLLLLAVAIAPELLAAPEQLTATLGVVLVAGVPGVLVLLALVARRRRIDRDTPEGE